MDPDSTPEFLLLPGQGDLSLPADYPRSKGAYEAARNVLAKSSLIKRDKDKQEVIIPRTVQDAVLAQMSETTLKATFEGFVTLLAGAWPWTSSFNHMTSRWKLCGQIFPHIERAKDQYLRMIEYEYCDSILLQFSRLLIEAGWYGDISSAMVVAHKRS